MSAAPNPVTFDSIKPLIVASDDENSGVFVTFRCPVTGMEVKADGPWPADGLLERTAGQVKRGLFASVRNSLARTVQTAIGSHTSSSVGSVGTGAAQQIIYGTGNEIGERKHRSDKDREAATVVAFSRVAGQFAWDEHTDRFVASSSPTVLDSEFDRLVAAGPIANEFDRDLIARMIASLIAGDGAISDTERTSFAGLFPSASLDQLVGSRAPGRVDFEESMPGPARETMLLLGWAVALTDERLSAEEQTVLATAAEGLGIDQERAQALGMIARSHVVDQAIAALIASGIDRDGVRTRVEDLGEQIGLGRDEAARAFIRWTKRAS